MTEIKVAFGHLATAQADVTGTAARIAHQLEELARFLAPMAGTWEGSAAEDYRTKQRQWDAAAADLAAVLGTIGTALGAANESYMSVERSNAARWR
jgi:6 kDa early secretory antigenic target